MKLAKLKQPFCNFCHERSSVVHNFKYKLAVVELQETHLGRTIATKGSKQISTVIPGGNPREKYSVILACQSDGTKLPPAVIVRSTRKKPRISLKNGVLVFHNPGMSMANSDIMSKWIRVMLDMPDHQKTLLILDSFRGHLTEHIRETCKSMHISRAVIPGSLTSRLQPLDLTADRAFKECL